MWASLALSRLLPRHNCDDDLALLLFLPRADMTGMHHTRCLECLVSAVLGLEESKHKESCCLQAQYQHDAPNEASSIKTWAVVFRDGGTPWA